MSLETTKARIEAEFREREWKIHLRDCSICALSMRVRQLEALCERGKAARSDKITAARDLAENRRLDKLPSPDQEAMF